jgi:hypothetical protein
MRADVAEAKAEGDLQEAERLQRQYWEVYNRALLRRQVFQEAE